MGRVKEELLKLARIMIINLVIIKIWHIFMMVNKNLLWLALVIVKELVIMDNGIDFK